MAIRRLDAEPTFVTMKPPVSASVGTTSVEILPANAERRYLYLFNEGTSNVYLAFGATAQVSKGIRLDPGGGYVFDRSAVPQQAVNAIAAAGANTVLIQEGE